MDTLSHALWGYGLFGHKRHAALALFFGAMPDLISFGAFMVVQLVTGAWHIGLPPLAILPDWLFANYAIGHSFVICLPLVLIMSLWRRDLGFAMLAWPFHIVLDFPFHALAYFPTQIFWPISDFKVDGIPWSRGYIWLPNVASLVILLTYRYRQKRILRQDQDARLSR